MINAKNNSKLIAAAFAVITSIAGLQVHAAEGFNVRGNGGLLQ
jgi:hypothetical protein